VWAAPQSGPAPRVYALTEAGWAALDRAAGEMANIERLLEEFSQRHEALHKEAAGQ
jgi:DNA-binding PadR family transcriptional regulator